MVLERFIMSGTCHTAQVTDISENVIYDVENRYNVRDDTVAEIFNGGMQIKCTFNGQRILFIKVEPRIACEYLILCSNVPFIEYERIAVDAADANATANADANAAANANADAAANAAANADANAAADDEIKMSEEEEDFPPLVREPPRRADAPSYPWLNRQVISRDEYPWEEEEESDDDSVSSWPAGLIG